MNTGKVSISILWALLPYVATFVGVYLVDQAILAVALYHLGIGFCCWRKRANPLHSLKGLDVKWGLGFGVLCLTTAPLIYFLWPWMVRDGVVLAELLGRWHLTGPLAIVFCLYSVTLHPALEETFWRSLLPDHWICDLLFAGFHVLVLACLVEALWLPLVFIVLSSVAWIWRWMVKRFQGLGVPFVSHALADLGVVIAVWALVI